MPRKPYWRSDNGPDVVGPAEARQRLGSISSQRLHQLRQNPRFPTPRTLEIGNVWDRAEIDAFQLSRTEPGRQRMLRALRTYRATGIVAQAARSAGVHPDTVRRWLRELDVPLPHDP